VLDANPRQHVEALESETAWILQFVCFIVVILAHIVASKKVKETAGDQFLTGLTGYRDFTLIFVLLMIFSNVMPYVLDKYLRPQQQSPNKLGGDASSWKLPWYCIALSVFNHTVIRICHIMGVLFYNKPDRFQIDGGWLLLMQWDQAGSLLAIMHGFASFAAGWVRSSHSDVWVRRFHLQFAQFVGAMRCGPALAIYYLSGESAVLERMLVVFVIPMVVCFAVARWMSALFKSMRHSENVEAEVSRLRSQYEELEAARRSELEAAHLRRLRRAFLKTQPKMTASAVLPIAPAAGRAPDGTVFPAAQAQPRSLPSGQCSEGVVRGGNLFGRLAGSAAVTDSAAGAQSPRGGGLPTGDGVVRGGNLFAELQQLAQTPPVSPMPTSTSPTPPSPTPHRRVGQPQPDRTID